MVALACAVVLLVGCVGVTQTLAPPPGSPEGPAQETVRVDDRTALLYLPPGRSDAPAPLVVVLHGYRAEAAAAVEFFGLRPLAEERGFVVVAPQGTTDPEGHAFWNASRACCNFHRSTVDDSGYLSRLIAAVAASQRIDPARVYILGHSNGGFMAHRMACEHGDQVAAIVSLAGAMDSDAACDPARPVSVLQVHGEADDTILYDGGAIDARPYTSATATVAWWRRANGCALASASVGALDADATAPGDDLHRTTWTSCRDDTGVALWTITDGGHAPALTHTFASALLDWLEDHRRPA